MITMPQELMEKMEKYKAFFPVPLLDLANDLGLEIYETNDLPNHQSGSLFHENGKFKIFVNAKHPLTRKRFTVAHEIAHYVLHKDKFAIGEEHIDDVKTPIKELKRANAPMTDEEKRMEIEANAVAADILMPEEEFRKVFDVATDIKEVAEKFRVSESAAAFRAQHLLGIAIM